MARPRKPTNVLEMKGAFKHDPQRERTDPEPQGPFGDPPPHLDDKQRAIWEEIEASVPRNVLTKADRIAVEALVHLVGRLRDEPGSMRAADFTSLKSYIGQFGMTPADRAKIAGPGEGKKNPFEDL